MRTSGTVTLIRTWKRQQRVFKMNTIFDLDLLATIGPFADDVLQLQSRKATYKSNALTMPSDEGHLVL